MTSAENSEFESIVADAPELELLGDSLPIVPMDGRRVSLDTGAGEHFRERLLAAYAFCIAEIYSKGKTPRDNGSGVEISRALFSEINNTSSPIQKGDLAAVTGLGFIAFGSMERTTTKFLTESFTLFGTVEGSTYGEFFNLPESELRQVSGSDTEVTAHSRPGGLVVINNPLVCVKDGNGEVIERAELALVPIHPPNLHFNRTLPIYR